MSTNKIVLIIYLLSVSIIAFCRDKANHDANWHIINAIEFLKKNDLQFYIADSTANKIASLEGVSENLKSEILHSDTLTITIVTTYDGLLSDRIFICNSNRLVFYQLCKINPNDPFILWDYGHVRNYIDYEIKYPFYDAFDLFLLYIYNWDIPIPTKILKDMNLSFDPISIRAARIISFPNKTVFNLYSEIKPDTNEFTTPTYTIFYE